MPRTRCPECGYPQSVCVCPWVKEVESPADIVILQHYRERDHAKNTVKLVKLAIAGVDVQVIKPGDNAEQAINLKDDKQYAVFFPNADSRPLEKNLSAFNANKYHKIIFLDGSWKQAGGMAQQINQYRNVHFFHFDQPRPSRYLIRHTTRTAALSTLEAVALMLDKAFSVNSQPLNELLEAFQDHWLAPVSHRRKS